MFKFVESREMDKNVTNEYINEIEKKFNIQFPNILREYYLNYNWSKEKACSFRIEGIDGEGSGFQLDTIIPLKYGNISLEKEYESVLEDSDRSNDYIPFAYDMDGEKYYWNSKTGKVCYISLEDVEYPIIICNSVDEFFDILNRSCEETITIKNLNYENNNIELEDEEIVENNEYNVDEILKYNGKFILKCNLVLLMGVIISVIIMPITDGLSFITAFAFAIWLMLFIVIDIANRIISSRALNKYDLNEIKKELLDKKSRKINGIDTYLTDNYIISNSNTIKITKYNDIVWTYLKRPMGTSNQRATLGIAYKIGGTPVVAHLKNGKKVVITLIKNSEQLDKIFRKIASENNQVLVGNSTQNIKKYENINKKYKVWNNICVIIYIILVLLVMIAAIYYNVIK